MNASDVTRKQILHIICVEDCLFYTKPNANKSKQWVSENSVPGYGMLKLQSLLEQLDYMVALVSFYDKSYDAIFEKLMSDWFL